MNFDAEYLKLRSSIRKLLYEHTDKHTADRPIALAGPLSVIIVPYRTVSTSPDEKAAVVSTIFKSS